MARPAWHLRHVRWLIYAGLCLAAVAIPVSCLFDAPSGGQLWVASRQLYGLWALSLLLAAMLIGPLTYILPWLPGKAHLVLGRRALGIGAFAIGACHGLAYLVPVGLRDWREIVSPGALWWLGLVLGATAIATLGVLTFTSTDHQLIQVGPQRWKRWQESVYWVLPVVIAHALMLGADFGLNKAPDFKGEADSGALVGMSLLSLTWLGLFLARRRRVRWTRS